MSESESESSVDEVNEHDRTDADHVKAEEVPTAIEESPTAGMGLQILAGSIVEFDPESKHARPFDVVAVHGYHGDKQTSWGGPYNNWLEDDLSSRYSSCRILTFGYEAHGINGLMTRGGIRKKAVQLLDELITLRNPSESDLFRPLIFISEDLGGIIVKEALCIAAFEYEKYKTIVQWSRLFIFFGCPHRCTSTQSLENAVGNLLFSSQHPRPISALGTIKEISRSIMEINGSFVLSKIPTVGTIVNFHSDEEDVALQIFDKYMASFDIAYSESSFAKSGPLKEISSTIPEEIIAPLDLVLGAYPKPSEYDNDSEQALRNLQMQAAIAYPLSPRPRTERWCSWITDRTIYKAWFESHGSNVLHLHGAKGAFEIGEYVFQHLTENRKNDEPLVYFEFDKYDDQRNSVAGMLNSICAQIYSHAPVFHASANMPVQQMVFYSSWTLHELWAMFRNFLTNLNHTGCFLVINGLDECDESIFPFLEKLSCVARSTEYRFKFVLVGTTNPRIQTALGGWPTNLMSQHASIPDLKLAASEVEYDVLGLIQLYPVLHRFRTIMTTKLMKCGRDMKWRRLILKELQHIDLQSESAIHNALDRMTPVETLQGILSRIPPRRQSWARKLLSWILYSYHPLSVWELAQAMSPDILGTSDSQISLDMIYSNLTAAVDTCFSGAIIFKHNLAFFGHPAARDFFASTLPPDAEKLGHRDILDTCQALLSSKAHQATMKSLYTEARDNDGSLPIFTHRYTLLTYAVKYWPKHLQVIADLSLGDPAPQLNKKDLEFVHHQNTMRIWAEAQWYLHDQIHRRDRGFLSPLPIFTGLGLKVLVDEWRASESSKVTYGEDSSLALVEAVRFSQTAIFNMFLESKDISEKHLSLALSAATASPNEEVLVELITYIGKRFPGFDWPATTTIRVCQFGQEKALRKLLEYGASPDVSIEMQGMTPLYAATREGHVEVVKLLLENKAKLDTKAQHVRTPLHAACALGRLEVAKLLIAAGADINALDEDKDAPVCLAALWANHEILTLMVKEPGVLLGSTAGTLPPLVIAADGGFLKCTKTLLEHKADTEAAGSSGWTALRYASANNDMDVINLLLDNGADPDTATGGDPLIIIKTSEERLDMIKIFIEHGAKVDATHSSGSTSLIFAVEYNYLDIVTYLLDHGAKVDAVDSVGATSLHCAAEKDHTETVTCLLDHGAAIDAQRTSGHTALALAASASHVATVKILLERGANVSIESLDFCTPMRLAYDDAEVARLLLEAGADPDAVQATYTPLYLAAMYGYNSVVELLLKYPINLETMFMEEGEQYKYTALVVATSVGNKDIARLLLEAGANVNHLSDRNNFPLQFAVRTDDPSMLRILMEYRPKLDLQDDDGDTVVGYIRESAPLEMYQILVNGGASLEIPNKNMQTPICAAVYAGNRLDLVKYFISKKANLNPVGGKHGAPLHMACAWENFELVEILVKAGADVNLVHDGTQGNPLQSAARRWDPNETREVQEKIIRYLIDEGHADVNIVGGLQGCALNAMCGWGGVDMVMLLLNKGASTEVVDPMGRSIIHYAALQSLENLQAIVSVGVDVNAKDAMGRNAMHWAIVSGSLSIVERILSLSRRLLDQVDNDGWTPLLWAARGCSTAHKETASNAQEQIITFLLDHGADILVKGEGLDRNWTAIQIARFHGANDEVIQLLITKTKEKLGKDALYIEAEHACLRGEGKSGHCDSCHIQIIGNRYKCEVCLDFDFCFKCYNSRLVMHNKDHTFKVIGPEFDIVVEVEKESTEDDNDSDEDTADDTDDEQE